MSRRTFSWPKASLFTGLAHAEGLRAFMLFLIGVFLVVTPWLRVPFVSHPLTSYFFLFVWFTTLLLALTVFGVWRGWFALPKQPLFAFAGVWLLVKIVAVFVSLVPIHSWWGAYGVWADGVFFLITLLTFLGVVATLRPTTREIKVIIHVLLVQVALISLHNAIVWLFGTPRPLSVFLNCDYYLSYACLLFPIAFVLLVQSVRQRTGPHPWQTPLINALQVLVIGVGLFVSLPVDLQHKVLFVPSHSGGSFLASDANAERFYQWELGAAIAQNYPWLGSGPGSTEAAFYDLHHRQEIKNWDYNVYMAHPHNDLIEQWSQTGWIGVSVYVGLFGAFWWTVWKNRRLIAPEIRPYALGVAMGFCLFALFNQFLFVLPYTAVLAGLWMIFLLFMTGQVGMFDDARYVRIGKVLSIILLVGFVVLSYWTVRYCRGEQLTIQAIRASRAGRVSDASLKAAQATAIFPYDEHFAWRASQETLTLITSGEATLSPTLLQTAIRFAERATTLNPHVPLYRVQHGVLLYLLNAPGTAGEAEGLTQLSKGLAQTPNDYTLHIRAARAFRQKSDATRMQQAIAAARAVVPTKKRPMMEQDIRSFAP